MDDVILIEKHSQLEFIESILPKLEGKPLILLTSNFTYEQLESYNFRGYRWFDEFISNSDSKEIGEQIEHFLWNWFLDEDSKDISVVDECSLGVTFASSIEILLNTIFRYDKGLRYLINKKSRVFYASSVEYIVHEVITSLSKSTNYTFECVVDELKEGVIQPKEINWFDYRVRDLSNLFYCNSFGKSIVNIIFNHIKRRGANKPKVLYMPAGKEEHYLKQVHNSKERNFDWVLPLNMFNFTRLSYYWNSCGVKLNTNPIIAKLDSNILKLQTELDCDLITRIFDIYIYIYISGAINYYKNAFRQIKAINPNLVICAADTYESFSLVAQAAKNLRV